MRKRHALPWVLGLLAGSFGAATFCAPAVERLPESSSPLSRPAIEGSSPREDVADIATLIHDYYFDVSRASTIARDLTNDAQAGVFDKLTDRGDLAVELTRRLRKIDGHFTVLWETEPPPQLTLSNATPPMEAAATLDRRADYGFRRVERLPGNIGYIDLSVVADIDFDQADSPAKRAADAALALVRGADAVILDVRANGGGAPSMAGYLVSAFVEPKADVFNVFQSRTSTESERPAVAYAEPMLTVPLYVLVGARTASAAESVAFTLQSCGRAKIVGERSAGAANPGMRFNTPQGLAIFISTGTPRNPINGRNWEGEGVKPDVQASGIRALSRAQELALEQILSGPIAGFERVDAQWALEALRNDEHPYAMRNRASYAGSYGPYTVKVGSATAGSLELMRERQRLPALIPLREDVFYLEGDPSRHYAFIRKNGAIIAMDVMRSRGDTQRLRLRSPQSPGG